MISTFFFMNVILFYLRKWEKIHAHGVCPPQSSYCMSRDRPEESTHKNQTFSHVPKSCVITTSFKLL